MDQVIEQAQLICPYSIVRLGSSIWQSTFQSMGGHRWYHSFDAIVALLDNTTKVWII